MKNENDLWIESRESIGNFLCKQFSKLFKAENPIQCPCLPSFIEPCISYSENEGIMVVPLDSEILDVFKSSNLAKTPRP